VLRRELGFGGRSGCSYGVLGVRLAARPLWVWPFSPRCSAARLPAGAFATAALPPSFEQLVDREEAVAGKREFWIQPSFMKNEP
jgi:hypothetical protein